MTPGPLSLRRVRSSPGGGPRGQLRGGGGLLGFRRISAPVYTLHASPQGAQPPWMLAPPAAAAQPTSVQSFMPSSPFGR